ncbi:hypothetical protein H6G04_23585 [Calothrix membranacea FACHB-236]|nr:hypothetical protein [Calothrix membranacea FACHB-236]
MKNSTPEVIEFFGHGREVSYPAAFNKVIPRQKDADLWRKLGILIIVASDRCIVPQSHLSSIDNVAVCIP